MLMKNGAGHIENQDIMATITGQGLGVQERLDGNITADDMLEPIQLAGMPHHIRGDNLTLHFIVPTEQGATDDEGISGTKVEKRDGLVMLLKDCEEGKIDRIITKSISRFSRNTTNTLAMVRNLSKLGIYIFFEKENIDTEHMSSELMLSILSSIEESESRSISENNKWSIKHRYEEGTYIIGYPPYSYDNVDGKMLIVPEEATVVREIFTWALSGKGSHIIAIP